MSHFQWNGRAYPMPQGWDGLSMEDWFYQLETVRDHLIHADDEDLQPIYDDRGRPLDPEEVLLIRVYGFSDGGHWEAFRNWGTTGWAAHARQDRTDLEFRMVGIARERMQREKASAMTAPGGGGPLDPVEGVSLEEWAHMQAALAGGGDIDQLIAQARMDRPKWDRVSAVWMQRMQTDTTHTVVTAYGNAFAGASQGQYGAHAAQAASEGVGGNVGAEPISLAHPSEFREVLVAVRAAYAARLPPEAHGESEAIRDFRRRRLADLVRTETDAYIERVTPKQEVGSLFAQAAARSRPRAAAASSRPSVTVRTCRRCGAPREADTLYGHCGFCGTAFFPARD